MKKTKRFASLLLALVMVFAMAVTASAATITNNTSGHSYDAYQIFSGTQADDSSALGDITWGSGINGDELLEELQEDYDYFDNCTTAADVAKVLEGKSDNCDEAKALAATATKHLTNTKTVIAADATDVTLAAGYWLLVDTTTPDDGDAKNAALLQVTNKGNITIDKKYDAPEVEKTVDDNDANIGDTVTFTLSATMPSTFEGYETYKVIFHDTMSAGLAYENISSVVVNNNELDEGKYSVDIKNNEDGTTTLTITIADVIALGADPSSKVVVTYTAIVDDDAIIGTEGNPNKVYLEYSNDPNWDGEGDEPTGDTPEDEVKVFTWEIPAVKIDGSTKSALSGAVFSLYKADETTLINVVAAGNNIYKVCTQTDCTDHTHVTQITTDETGKFNIEGLEQGTYYLKEITAPAGYNKLTEAIKVVVGKDGVITVGSSTVTETVTIENNQGATLPETGGTGTTVFYILGGILMVAAAILLVTKRRMNANR